jgi:hypothetical protein
MKTILIGLLAGTAMLGFRNENKPAEGEELIQGIWQGAYGTHSNIEKLVVTLKPDNTMEFYEGEQTVHKTTGTYVLMGDTAIVISYKDQKRVNQVYMYGNINKNKNFVDGIWESEGNPKGSFYLQKQSFQL